MIHSIIELNYNRGEYKVILFFYSIFRIKKNITLYFTLYYRVTLSESSEQIQFYNRIILFWNEI